MRTMTPTMTAAQIAASKTPYIRVYFTQYAAGGDTTADYSSRLLALEHIETPGGGTARFRLWNGDGAVVLNWIGSRVDIGYGYVTGSGNEYLNTAPLWVMDMVEVSFEGCVCMEVECIDNWQKLQALKTIGDEIAVVAGWEETLTIEEIIEELLTDTGIDLVDDGGDTLFQTYTPRYLVESVNTPVADAIIDVMSMCSSVCRMENDGDLHVFELDPDNPPAVQYTFEAPASGTHPFYRADYNVSLCHGRLPNRIIVVDYLPDNYGIGQYAGYFNDTTSQGMWDTADFNGIFTEVFPDSSVTSDADATTKAALMWYRMYFSKNNVVFDAPMAVELELFDYVRIVDNRASNDFSGYIGSITRVWAPGLYKIEILIGGLQISLASDGAPRNKDYRDTDIRQRGKGSKTPIPPQYIRMGVNIPRDVPEWRVRQWLATLPRDDWLEGMRMYEIWRQQEKVDDSQAILAQRRKEQREAAITEAKLYAISVGDRPWSYYADKGITTIEEFIAIEFGGIDPLAEINRKSKIQSRTGKAPYTELTWEILFGGKFW